jgi:hypothetical protein
MKDARIFSRIVVPALKRRRMFGAGAAILAAAALTGLAVAAPLVMALFAVYTDDSGTVLTQSSDPTTLNGTNPFFDPSIGKNGRRVSPATSHLLA